MREINYKAEMWGETFLIFAYQPAEGIKWWYLENGYVMRKVNKHPKQNSRGYVAEHRLVMEQTLGRFLDEKEFVHHIDGDRGNNDPSNLKLVDSRSHYEEHSPIRNDNGQFVVEEPIFKEIKYRLFDKDNKITQIYTLQELVSKTYRRAKFQFRGRFTGLKDKNGKEIYEGDVVKGYWWQKGDSHRHIGKVTYGMAAFKVVGVKQYLGFSDELSPVYEVIGNIYENPELIQS